MSGRGTVVVVGATGHFGRRICRRLLSEQNIRRVVTSRSEASARNLAAESGREPGSAEVAAAVVDQQAPDVAERLADLDPFIVLHTAGPYQGADHGVARACIAIGCHYIDLADGRDFVATIAKLNDSAMRAGDTSRPSPAAS